jgi:hypothetical protein
VQLEQGGSETDKYAFHGTILPFFSDRDRGSGSQKLLQKCNGAFWAYDVQNIKIQAKIPHLANTNIERSHFVTIP